jgi:dipeptidyl aminopeptidase/acylaminoacyl peptidase
MVRWGLDARVVSSLAEGFGPPDNPASWRRAGQRWHELAAKAKRNGRLVTAAEWARQAFFCNRLSESQYFDECAEKQEAYDASLASFDLASATYGERLRSVSVPFRGFELPGLFLRPIVVPRGGVPAVLALFGADGNKEEHLWATLEPFAQRGAAALVVDGPGHGYARRKAGLGAIADYERVASACADVLSAQPEVDAGRLGIAGSSLGGYYAPRAFAADARWRACVVNSAVFNVAEGFWDPYPPIRPQLQYVAGKPDSSSARRLYETFSLEGLSPITRPMRVYHGAADRMIPPEQARLVCEAAGRNAELVLWPNASHNLGNVGIEAHPTIWDWLVTALRF